VRMMSLEATFTRMQRLARDVARELGKDIELTVTGAATELDRSVVDEVLQPLVHLVRNAIDHGIEDAATRAARGKPPAGQVHIAAEQRGPEVVIEVRDDGAGIDLEGLARKAVERGLVAPDDLATLAPARIYDLMFLPGFTSRDAAGMVSGRGVGLDVVRSEVEAQGGSVTVDSEAGIGSVFSLHFPLSLVVLDALLVEIDGDLWALPVAKCRETLVLPAAWAGDAVIEHRDQQLPVIDGRRVLACREDEPAGEPGDGPTFGVVVREGGDDHVLRVDRLHDRVEVVVKPAPKGIPGTEHIAGATILAAGEVALVPDLALIVRRSREPSSEVRP
jgi:two-component system chemotaxis sensor kinase CheA